MMRGPLIMLLALLAVGAAILVWLNRRPQADPDSLPHPPFSDSPYLNTGPDARYTGIASCRECHSGRYDSYLHTAHSRAFTSANPAAEPPDGTFLHKASGRSYRVYRAEGQLRHEELLRAPDGREIARVDLPVRYLLGSGHFSRSYLVEVDGFLFESPITWYTQKQVWDVSPGYDYAGHPGFTRAIGTSCLACHMGRVQPQDEESHRVSLGEQPIGCESCHGPGSKHVEYHRLSKHAPGTPDLTIVNPSRLSRSRLESVCAVCHLSGSAATVDVRGRKVGDFRPGLPLSDFRMDYDYEVASGQMRVVGHLEQLRQSACYKASPEMSCLTCHDPHLEPRGVDPVALQRKNCLNCHSTRGCSVPAVERLKSDPKDSCAGCHMPRGKTDIPHIAFTHHRIARRHTDADTAEPDSAGAPNLIPIDDSTILPDLDRRRNLGLAYLEAGERASKPERAIEFRKRSLGLLQATADGGLRDAPTLSALAVLHWKQKDNPRAMTVAHEALEAPGATIDARISALHVLLKCQLAGNEMGSAAATAERLTNLRLVADDWQDLGACQLGLKQPQRARESLERSVRYDPFRKRVHAALAEAFRQTGDVERARDFDEKERLLQLHSHP